MKHGIFFLIALCLSDMLYAQQFQTKERITLPAASKPSEILWAEIDADSLLDLVITDTSKNHLTAFCYSGFLKGVIRRDSLFTTSLSKIVLSATDFNKDNAIDLVITGTDANGVGGTQIFLNNGNFKFSAPIVIASSPGSKLSLTDFNNDSQRDLLLLKDSTALMLLKNSANVFHSIWDSTSMVIKDFSVSDFDGNGFKDIAISGTKSSKPFLTIIEFKSRFDTLRVVHVAVPNSGKIATGDLDQDGWFDLIISGTDPTGHWITQAWLSRDSLFVPGQVYTGVNSVKMEIADFDSDGLADVSLFGKDAMGNQTHLIAASVTPVSIPSKGVLREAFGDYDRDGDLDLLQVNDTLGVVLLENTTKTSNFGPLTPAHQGGALIYNRLFAYWDQSQDDHTPSPSITYDLMVFSNGAIYNDGEFDAKNNKRLTVTNGNQVTNNFALLNAPPGVVSINAESVDNAYFTSSILFGGGTGVAVGTTPPANCNVDYKTLYVCGKTTSLTIKETTSVKWFSFSDGYLKTSGSIKLKNPAADTVFSFIPPSGGCPKITAYTITPSVDSVMQKTAHYTTCVGGNVVLSLDPQWKNIQWTIDGHTTGNSANPFTYFPKNDDPILATAKNAGGCYLHQTDNITISVPVLTLAETKYTVSAGQDVQIHASGGQAYQWTPPDGLDQTNVPNPIASPLHSTTYTVTMSDSIGCTVSGVVDVTVIQNAFIPSLFTPNGDGRNEELKIYGLGAVSDFHFRVVNREGATVYETSDAEAVSSEGWNGAHNGTMQPSGLYYWKVEGEADNGVALQLNGKRQGSVMLVR